jgi:adenylosuccinate lyase
MSREAAYAAVQRAAMATWTALGTDGARDFAHNLLADADVAARLDASALVKAMDPARDFGAVDAIFARVLGET